MNSKSASNQGSRIARLSAARLAAVQAVYQMKANDQDVRSVVSEFKTHRLGKPVEGQNMVLPDAELFTTIVAGVSEREADLNGMIEATLQNHNSAKTRNTDISIEPLLWSILLCGSYELLAHHDTDAPVIISDYIDVAHAFYEGGEPKLVNGVLDKIGRNLRS